MPSTLFDSAGLAIVAYAQVDGATGSSSSTALANSGVSTTKISTGIYQIFLPTGLAQAASKDLIFIQPKAVPTTTAIQLGDAPVANVVELADGVTKQVLIRAAIGTTALDSDFDALILRTVLP